MADKEDTAPEPEVETEEGVGEDEVLYLDPKDLPKVEESDPWDGFRAKYNDPMEVARRLEEAERAADMRRSAHERYEEAARMRDDVARERAEIDRQRREMENLVYQARNMDPEDFHQTVAGYTQQQYRPYPQSGAPQQPDPMSQEILQRLDRMEQNYQAQQQQHGKILFDQSVDQFIRSDPRVSRHDVNLIRSGIQRRMMERGHEMSAENVHQMVQQWGSESVSELDGAFNRYMQNYVQRKREVRDTAIPSGSGPSGAPRTKPAEAKDDVPRFDAYDDKSRKDRLAHARRIARRLESQED